MCVVCVGRSGRSRGCGKWAKASTHVELTVAALPEARALALQEPMPWVRMRDTWVRSPAELGRRKRGEGRKKEEKKEERERESVCVVVCVLFSFSTFSDLFKVVLSVESCASAAEKLR